MAAAKNPGASAPSTAGNASPAKPAASPSSSAAGSQSPVIPAGHTPTPAQQSPNVRKPLAPYIPEANPNAPKDPVQAMRERERSAIESRMPKRSPATSESAQTSSKDPASSAPKQPVSSSPEAGNTAGEAAANKQSSEPGAPPKEPPASSASAEQQQTSEDTSTQSSSKRGPRYDVKTMKRWAEENPEQAAEIRTHVFGYDPSSNEGFIKLSQKKRAVRKEIDEHRETSLATIATRETEAKTQLEKLESVATGIRPLMDMWEGGKRRDQHGNPMPDFDAVDAAFQQVTAGLDIDSYMRLRARRGVANPEMARLRAENARLKAGQGAPASATPPAAPGATQSQSNGAAAPAQSPAVSPPAAAEAPKPAAPTDLEKKWGADVPKSHKLRQIAGWAEKFDAEMEKFHDETLDEYSVDPEVIADSVLKRELALLVGEPEEDEAPEPQRRAKPRPKPKAAATSERPRRASFAPPDHRELMNNPALLAPRQESQRARRVGVREGFEDYGSAENPRDPLIRDRPERYGDRTQWAIARAQARARGEMIDD